MIKVEQIKKALKHLADENKSTYQEMVTRFFIERVVLRLTEDELLHETLVFKGGFVSVSLYKSPRYTTDLDAIISGKSSKLILARVMEAMTKDIDDSVWFILEKTVDLATQNEYGGTRLQFRTGFLPQSKDTAKAQILHIDIGIGDPVTPDPKVVTIPTLLGEESLSWKVYPVETIIAEKLHPLVIRGDLNSRSKDIFDLNLLLPKADKNILRQAIEKTFQYRKTSIPRRFSTHLSNLDTEVLMRGWTAATRSIRPVASFQSTYENVVKMLEELEL